LANVFNSPVVTHKILHGRIKNIRQQLSLVVSELKGKYNFSLPVAELCFWLDGSGLAKTPIVMGCWKLLLHKPTLDLLDNDDNKTEILQILRKTHVFLIVPASEKKEFLLPIFQDSIQPIIKDLEGSNIDLCGFSIKASVKLFLADNKATQVIFGLNNGNFPCCCCYSSRKHFHSYIKGMRSQRRTHSSIFEKASNLGIDDSLLPAGDMYAPLFYDELGVCCAKDMIIGVDTLHIIENVGTAVITSVLSTVDVDSRNSMIQVIECASTMSVVWSGDSPVISNNTCANIRDTFMMINSMDYTIFWRDEEKGRKMKEILDIFRQIIVILYSSPYSRCDNLVYALYFKTWHFSVLLSEAFPPEVYSSLYSLPYHQLISHLPQLSRNFFLADLTTESYESLWKQLRIDEKYHSTHRGDISGNMFLRIHFREQMKAQFGNSGFSSLLQNEYSRSVDKIFDQTILPSSATCNSTGNLRDDFLVMLWNISDAMCFISPTDGQFNVNLFNYTKRTYTLNADRSVTFFSTSRDMEKTFTLRIPFLHDDYVNFLKENFARNPLNLIMNDESENFEILADDVFSPCLYPETLPMDSCKKVLKLRRAKTSQYDALRNEILTTSFKYQDILGKQKSQQYPVKQLQEKIESDNNILLFREKSKNQNPLPPEDSEFKWNLFLEKEKHLLQLSLTSIITEFEKPAHKETRLIDPHQAASFSFNSWKKFTVTELEVHMHNNRIPLRAGKKNKTTMINSCLDYYADCEPPTKKIKKT